MLFWQGCGGIVYWCIWSLYRSRWSETILCGGWGAVDGFLDYVVFGMARNCTGCFVGFDRLCCFRFVYLRRQGGMCHVCWLGTWWRPVFVVLGDMSHWGCCCLWLWAFHRHSMIGGHFSWWWWGLENLCYCYSLLPMWIWGWGLGCWTQRGRRVCLWGFVYMWWEYRLRTRSSRRCGVVLVC
jgi:hypothetical protein